MIDPITFEVIRNALVAATDEMVLALKRSAYSTNIKTRADFSCAFFDAELRAVAQGFTQPVHLGSMVEQTPRAIRDYGPENLGPGDVIITNDPFPSGVHLNDVTLISPVQHEAKDVLDDAPALDDLHGRDDHALLEHLAEGADRSRCAAPDVDVMGEVRDVAQELAFVMNG